jgi:hypothetical protein
VRAELLNTGEMAEMNSEGSHKQKEHVLSGGVAHVMLKRI